MEARKEMKGRFKTNVCLGKTLKSYGKAVSLFMRAVCLSVCFIKPLTHSLLQNLPNFCNKPSVTSCSLEFGANKVEK